MNLDRETVTNVSLQDLNMSLKAIWLLVLGILVLGGSDALAGEVEFDHLGRVDVCLPSWKFSRGLNNVLGGPHELVTYMTNYAIQGSYNGAYENGFYGYVSGATTGYVAGIFPGLYHMVKRMSSGCLEILTFWRPEYGPVTGPTYGVRGLASGSTDYFNKDPFWYVGPTR
ncbi:MAG: hypothetical protein QG577_2714 [Thermodesulfobacteriota bacterium]|nr:hypothetical protein [Thermodesulfobacteriota bacterium]